LESNQSAPVTYSPDPSTANVNGEYILANCYRHCHCVLRFIFRASSTKPMAQ
jgi:hypothetical protein